YVAAIQSWRSLNQLWHAIFKFNLEIEGTILQSDFIDYFFTKPVNACISFPVDNPGGYPVSFHYARVLIKNDLICNLKEGDPAFNQVKVDRKFRPFNILFNYYLSCC